MHVHFASPQLAFIRGKCRADAGVCAMCLELIALPALESLSLASNHLTANCAPALAMIVREADPLVLFDISSNVLKAAGVRCVVQASRLELHEHDSYPSAAIPPLLRFCSSCAPPVLGSCAHAVALYDRHVDTEPDVGAVPAQMVVISRAAR
jgi:hypothetical protein